MYTSSRSWVAEEGEIFRKGNKLLGPEEMEGEYAGEELRIEVRGFLVWFRRSSGILKMLTIPWFHSYWRLRWNDLLRVPFSMTYRSHWTRPSSKSALRSRKSNQSLHPRSHTFRVDLRRPSPQRSSPNLPPGTAPRRAQIALRHCRRSRGRTCPGKRSRARPSNPGEKPAKNYYGSSGFGPWLFIPPDKELPEPF